MGGDIVKVGDIIPGTRKEEWTKTNQDKPYEDLLNAIVKSAVDDIRFLRNWVKNYPKRHNGEACRPRNQYELRTLKNMIREKDYAEGFLGNTYIGQRVKHEAIEEGTDYDYEAILKSGIQTERGSLKDA